MRYEHAAVIFWRMLERAGLRLRALEPAPTWRVFIDFLREPVDGALGDALVQYGVYEDDDGVERAHLYFVREFAAAAEEPVAEEEAPPAETHIICDLVFPPDLLRAGEHREYWTQDAPSLDHFIARVEADPEIRKLLAARSTGSAIYGEEQ